MAVTSQGKQDSDIPVVLTKTIWLLSCPLVERFSKESRFGLGLHTHGGRTKERLTPSFLGRRVGGKAERLPRWRDNSSDPELIGN